MAIGRKKRKNIKSVIFLYVYVVSYVCRWICNLHVVTFFTDMLSLFDINIFPCNCQRGDNSKKKTSVTLFKIT